MIHDLSIDKNCKLRYVGGDQRFHNSSPQLSIDHGNQMHVPKAEQPGRLG